MSAQRLGERLALSSEAPQRLGDYQIVDVLGAGGMGLVYRARHLLSEREVAIKTVRVATESMLESIRREIQMLRELRHPGVISVLEHGVEGATPWYAMELLRGRTLRDELDMWSPVRRHDATTRDPAREVTALAGGVVTRDLGAPAQPDRGDPLARTWTGSDLSSGIDVQEADERCGAEPEALPGVLRLFRKICLALAYVHGQGILHRDLSPSNVFLLEDGAEVQPVLFDFGLAGQFRTASGRDVLEVGGLLRGTAHYMAPEQARGEVVDARADVYSLGCMLYEALTGRPPFLAESPLAVLLRHCEDLAPAPSVLAPQVPRALDSLVLHMLDKRPRDRIGYAEDVAAELARIERSLDRSLEPEGGPRARTELSAGERPRPYVYRPGLAGRQELVELLEELMFGARQRDGRGGCVALVGEGGVGKTRLAGELATRARERDLTVLTGECEQVGVGEAEDLRAGPLAPLRPVLRAVAERCREGGALERERLLGASGGLLAAYEPALAELAPAVHDHVDPATARFRVLAVLGDTLRALVCDTPTLLVLDDLQWADELTLAVLSSLGQSVPGLWILTTVRAEEMSPALDGVLTALGAAVVQVPRLDAEAVGAMVKDMLALEDAAPALTSLVAGWSEGNPYFAAEYVRVAVEEGALHRDIGGRWQLRESEHASFSRLATPGSVQTLVARRLTLLSPLAREIALAAAVLGRALAAPALVATAGCEAEVARGAVVELLQRHVLVDAGDAGLRFLHARLRDHVYSAAEPAARRELHRRAAHWLELAPVGDAPSARWAELALHWEHCGELRKTADYLERAAEHALYAAAFGEARTLLRRLLELPLGVDAERSARWQRRLGEACFALGDLPAAASHAQQSLDQLGHSLPRSRAGWATSIGLGIGRQVASRLARSRRLPALLRSSPRVSGRAPASGQDSPLVEAALASARMTSYYFFANEPLGLLGSSLQAVNLAERVAEGVPVAEIYAQLGYIARVARLSPVARGYFAKARATAKATRDRSGLAWAYFTEAACCVGNAELARAREVAHKGLAIAEALRNPQDVEVAHTILGHCDFAGGDYHAALEAARRLYDSAHARTNRQHEAWGLYTQARSELYLGRLEPALEGFAKAQSLLAGTSDRASQILCGGLGSLALLRVGRVAEARAQAEAVSGLIGARTPPVFTIAEGFVCTAETFLELWRRGEATSEASARRAISDVARLARLFAIARPAAAALAGLYHLHRGHGRRARLRLQQSLALARSLGLPYDEARAHAGLAAVPNLAASAKHAAAARGLYQRLGCAWHVGNA